MAHGQTDFGAYAAKETVGSMADNAELAARLGSICTFDRRGDVIWLDGFESGVAKWQPEGPAAGESAVWSAERAANGGFSYKLATAAILNNRIEVNHYESYPVLSKIGFEIGFTEHKTPTGFYPEYRFELNCNDGTTWYLYRVRYIQATGTLEVLHNGVWTQFAAGVNLFLNNYLFNTIKLVGGFPTPRAYVRCIFNNVEYDLTGYVPQVIAPPAGPALNVAVRITANSAEENIVYLDNAIITQNEP